VEKTTGADFFNQLWQLFDDGSSVGLIG